MLLPNTFPCANSYAHPSFNLLFHMKISDFRYLRGTFTPAAIPECGKRPRTVQPNPSRPKTSRTHRSVPKPQCSLF